MILPHPDGASPAADRYLGELRGNVATRALPGSVRVRLR
jgi:hypothetical protein